MGKVIVIGKNSILASNNCQVDYDIEEVEKDGIKMHKNVKIIIIEDYFGVLSKGEEIEYAYRNDDDDRISGKGKISRISQYRCAIEIGELTNNYQQLIRRAKEWLVQQESISASSGMRNL